MGEVLHVPQAIGEVANTRISPPCGSSPCSSRVGFLQRQNPGEGFPQSFHEGTSVLRPLSAEGRGISNSPIPLGLIEYYGLRLHNFTPASILHIAGYVALCESFLGCESHFDLWRRLFCLVLHNHEGSIFEVGGAEI